MAPSRLPMPATCRPTSTATRSQSRHRPAPRPHPRRRLRRNHPPPRPQRYRSPSSPTASSKPATPPANSSASTAPAQSAPNPPNHRRSRPGLRPGRRHHRPHPHLHRLPSSPLTRSIPLSRLYSIPYSLFPALQHRIVFRFFPTRPIFSIFAMYAAATGTSHAVSPTSTDTSPISRRRRFRLAQQRLHIPSHRNHKHIHRVPRPILRPVNSLHHPPQQLLNSPKSNSSSGRVATIPAHVRPTAAATCSFFDFNPFRAHSRPAAFSIATHGTVYSEIIGIPAAPSAQSSNSFFVIFRPSATIPARYIASRSPSHTTPSPAPAPPASSSQSPSSPPRSPPRPLIRRHPMPHIDRARLLLPLARNSSTTDFTVAIRILNSGGEKTCSAVCPFAAPGAGNLFPNAAL